MNATRPQKSDRLPAAKPLKEIKEYRPDIDGLRAISVLSVIFFHAGFGKVSGGFVGVDVFYVISGYLITQVLLSDLQSAHFSLTTFYERRARRILPALFFVISVCMPLAIWLMPPPMLKNFGDSVQYTIAFLANVYFSTNTNYFSTSSRITPLVHTWSLAVEEQYYIVFPLFLFLVWKYLRSYVVQALAVVLVISLVLSEVGVRFWPESNFYLAPARAWEIIAGAICAAWVTDTGRVENGYAALLGLGLIGFSVLAYTSATPFPSLYTLVPVIGATHVILFSGRSTIAGKLLSARPVVQIGLISYSAYLWHQPVFAFARLMHGEQLSETFTLALIFAVLAISYLSWRFIEMPFRLRRGVSAIAPKTIWTASGGIATVLLLAGLGLSASDGLLAAHKVPAFVRDGQWDLAKIDNGWCFYSVDTIESLPVGEAGVGCHLGATDGAPILLFGDSFGGQYEPFWDEIGKSLHLDVNAITTNWCHPAFTSTFVWPKPTRALAQCLYDRNYVENHEDDYDVIVLASHWRALASKSLQMEMVETIETVLQNTGARIVIMPSPPRLERISVQRYVYGDKAAVHPSSTNVGSDSRMEQVFYEKFGSNSRVLILSWQDIVGTKEPSGAIFDADGNPYSWDGEHISIFGSLEVAHAFEAASTMSVLRQYLTN